MKKKRVSLFGIFFVIIVFCLSGSIGCSRENQTTSNEGAGGSPAEPNDPIDDPIVAPVANDAPILDQIADITINELETVTFVPTANDPDGDSLTFSYSGWMNTSTYTTTYADAGVHTVTITASDGSLTDSKTVTVNVTNLNRQPVANAGTDQAVDEKIQVPLNGSNSLDLDNQTLTYSWTQTAGTIVSLSDLTAVKPTFTAPVITTPAETLTFQLIVNDSIENSLPDLVDITI